MPRVHFVKKARKDYPQYGIVRGSSYYHWSFRYGGRRMSKTYPKPSQLTQSEFLAQLYDLQEEIAGAKPENVEELVDLRDDWCNRIRDLGSECDEKLNNMPEGLQQGDTGQLLQERIDAMENWACDLENINLDIDDTLEGDALESAQKELLEDGLQQIQGTDCGL